MTPLLPSLQSQTIIVYSTGENNNPGFPGHALRNQSRMLRLNFSEVEYAETLSSVASGPRFSYFSDDVSRHVFHNLYRE